MIKKISFTVIPGEFNKLLEDLEIVTKINKLDTKLYSKIVDGHVDSDGLITPEALDKIIDNYNCYMNKLDCLKPGVILAIKSEWSNRPYKFLVTKVKDLDCGRLSISCLDKDSLTLYLDETQFYDSTIFGILALKDLLN